MTANQATLERSWSELAPHRDGASQCSPAPAARNRVPVDVAVSVIICAWTEERLSQILACVTAVERQTLPAREIIVVVDGNPELRLTLMRELGESVNVIDNPGGRGAGSARNAGMAIASGDVAAFVDDDAEPAADWIENFVPRFRDPNVLGVGGRIDPIWDGGRPRWFPDEFGWAVGCTYRGLPESTAPVRNLIAANMIVRLSAVLDSGGFAGHVCKVGLHFGGPEEHELCHRVQQENPDGVWLYDPRVRVRHHVPATRSSWSYFRHRCQAEGWIKAKLVAIVGSDVGLSSERAHVVVALRKGVQRHLRAAARTGDVGELQRASAIVLGLLFTAYGYLRVRLELMIRPEQTLYEEVSLTPAGLREAKRPRVRLPQITRRSRG